MTEPDVALTDYFLALECLLFAGLMGRHCRSTRCLRFWFTVYFAAGSVASACGGTLHGFFQDEQTPGHAILWRGTLLAVGVATVANWAIGARLLFSPLVARWVIIAAGVQLAAYVAVVFFWSHDFSVAVADNLPAVLFLILALLLAYRRQPRAGLLVAAGGMSLTLLAAALQQFRVAVHPQYFNHNAVFHVVQAVAVLVFFLGARTLVGADVGSDNADRTESGSNAHSSSDELKTSQGDSHAHAP